MQSSIRKSDDGDSCKVTGLYTSCNFKEVVIKLIITLTKVSEERESES